MYQLRMMAGAFPSSFEDSNHTRRHAIERWQLENVDESQQTKQNVMCFLNCTSFYTVVSLPDFRKWQPEFKTRVLSAIVDRDAKEDLVKCGRINWCPNVRTLVPLIVPRDGNSLAHAVATAVWGITDRSMLLRRFLCLTLGVDIQHRFHSRWLYHRQRQINQFVDRLFESGNQVMVDEWTEVRQCLEPDRSQSISLPDRGLEPIHIYSLCNILRRPIIVLADPVPPTHSLRDSDMGGIYLPLEWSWMDTCRVPVLLGCSRGHFVPLLFADHPNPSLTGQDSKRDLVPLVSSRFEQLPVRLLLHGEEPHVAQLLNKYLKVRETVMRVEESVQNVLCAEVEPRSMPEELNIVNDFVHDCVRRFQQDHRHPAPPPSPLNPQDWTQIKQEHGQSPATRQPPGLTREMLQGSGLPQYALGDPSLHHGAGDTQHHIHIQPPVMRPPRSIPEQSISLNPPAEQKCKSPGCKFYGDPTLGMHCSSCFTTYTIREAKQIGPAARSHPSAPLDSLHQEQQLPQLSMMREKCKVNCGYYCSTKTYPYCHECAAKIQKRSQEEALAAAFNEAAFAPSNPEQGPGAVAPAGTGEEVREASGHASHNLPLLQPSEGRGPCNIGQADPVSQQTPNVPEAQAGDEALTKAMVTGDPPVLGSEDQNPALLFGIGQEVEATSSPAGQASSEPQGACAGVTATSSAQCQAGQTTSSAQSHVDQATLHAQASTEETQPSSTPASVELTSAAHLAKTQPAPTVHSAHLEAEVQAHAQEEAVCSKEGCGRAAQQDTLCGKCFVGQDVRSMEMMMGLETPGLATLKPTEPVSLTEQKFQMLSLQSTSSSAPPSMGPTPLPVTLNQPHSAPKSNATYMKETGAAAPLQQQQQQQQQQHESRSQPSSLRDLRNIPEMNDYARSWVQENRFVQHNPLQQSGPWSAPPPQGLPEKPESVGLGNDDLIASGAGCFSSTQHCIGDGCNNPVLEAGKLCQQCQDILRQARQSQGAAAASASASGQAEQSPAEEKQCHTTGCSFYGNSHTLGYCTNCYRQHFEREMSEKRRATSQRTITVPPDFNYVHTAPERQGKLCLAAGCRLFGDPKHSGMCFKHFQQHLATLTKATRGLPPTPPNPTTTTTTINRMPPGSNIRVTPTSITVMPGNMPLLPSELSVPPPSISRSRSKGVGEPSLGETYYRVAGRHTSTCLNPSCTNFGNSKKGGLCNSCAQDQKIDDDLISRAIYGDEETG